jgi:hypothetical protein
MDSMLKRDPNHCPDPDYDRTTSSTLQSTKHNDHAFMGRTGRLMGGPLPDLVVRAPSRRSERPLGGGPTSFPKRKSTGGQVASRTRALLL